MEYVLAALLAPFFRFLVLKPIHALVRVALRDGPLKKALLMEWET